MPRARTLVLMLPLLELALLIVLGTIIGGWNALLYVLASGVLGSILVQIAKRGQPQSPPGIGHPAMALMGGGTMLISGVLLMIPGLLTDTLGVLLLIPGFKTLLAKGVRWSIQRKLAKAGFDAASMGGNPFGAGSPFGGAGSPFGGPGSPFEGFGGPPGAGPTPPDAAPIEPPSGGSVVVEAEVVDERPDA